MTTFNATRDIPAPPEKVFAAMADPKRLARWWGPAGFTNTFTTCDFKPGGQWSFTMHGPDGKNYSNESVFAEIDANKKVVVQHVSEPKFALAITLTPTKTGTTILWEQTFESDEMARKIEPIVVPANDQNLERWAAEVMGK